MLDTNITLNDIAGYDDQKEEARKIINVLKNYEIFKSMGAYISKGLVLSGPCGTGKTSLAKAIANESGVPFFELECKGMSDEDNTIDEIRMIFAKARKNAPSIVFIDEVDEFVTSRTFMSDSSRKTLKVLLTEIDGINSNEGVLVIVTTNFKEELPYALTRSGRMDKKINMPIPDAKSRYEITNYYLRKNAIFDGISTIELSSRLGGFSGADIKTLVNETLIDCLSNGKSEITLEDFDKIIPVVRFQEIKKNKAAVPEFVCVHEAGHFLVSYLLTGNIGSLTVEQYGDVKGAHVNEYDDGEEEESEEVRGLVSNIKKEIAVLLAGNVAEKIKMNGDCSTGSRSDITRAIALAEEVASSGVDGYDLFYVKDAEGPTFMKQKPQETLEQKNYKSAILKEASDTAERLIMANMNLFDAVVNQLKVKRRLSKEQLSKIVGASKNDVIYDNVKSYLPTLDVISTSFIQEEMNVSFAKANRIVKRLESEGLIEPSYENGNHRIIK